MPVATTTGQATERFELATLPKTEDDEAGFVVLRRMAYGEYLQRREMASRMYWETQDGKEEMQGSMQLVNRAVVEMEFANCIVEHNLTDSDGNLLNLKNAMFVRALDPRVGQEIGSLIDKMNKFEGEGN